MLDSLQHLNFEPTDLAAVQSSPMLKQSFREDADAIFMARQLDYVRTQTYNRQLPAINADRLCPDDTSVPEWAETVTQYMFDAVGMAKVIANYADDLPRADVRALARQVTVRTLGDSYGYNVNELRASRATGMGLDTRKADAARRSMDLKIASIKMVGDPAFNLYGLFNNPNVPTFVQTNPGDWMTLTGDQILQNIQNWIIAYQFQTKGTHIPNHLELAPKAYNAAASKFVTAVGVATPMTPLQWINLNYPYITVENIWELNAITTTGKDMGLLYDRNPDNLAHIYVMPFTQLPPEARNLEIITDCIARSGGVNIYYPLSMLNSVTT